MHKKIKIAGKNIFSNCLFAIVQQIKRTKVKNKQLMYPYFGLKIDHGKSTINIPNLAKK